VTAYRHLVAMLRMSGTIPACTPCVCLDGVDKGNVLREQYKITVLYCCVIVHVMLLLLKLTPLCKYSYQFIVV
jgi:hypothetical protein